ncbi:MAG: hypothetical protein AAGA20_16300 [Planctomycetota bacterium]
MTSHAAGRGATLALGAALVTFALGLVWSAWLADDAFITFRCMDNFVHGRGLVWNVDERVQAFTNPLWLFLLAGPYALTGSLYPIAIGAGVLVTAVAVALVVRSASSRWTAAVCVLALAGSKAFLEYSTSGLENPLLHVAVLLAAGAYLAPIDQERRAVGVAAATTLAFLTRPDALLFTGILCVAVWLERPTLRALGRMALAWLPAFAWEAFSVAYFGTFVPNTAIAKLSGELPRAEMIDQGLLYLANSLRWDPLTLTTVAVALLTFAPRPGRWRRRESLVMIAVALHLAYVVSVGGDFMSGRFLTTSFAVSVFLLARLRVDPRVLGAAAAMAVVLGVATERSPWRPRPGPMAFLEALDPAGITDERAIYYAFTGLVSEGHPTWGRMVDGDPYPPAEYARAQLAEGERVQIHGQVGMLGHFAGPGVHVLDVMGLGDPLLARMPLRSAEGEWLFASKLNRFGRYWRIGHLRRPAPPGYRESLAADENLVRDDALARYYGAIRALTRDPMWSRSRWRTLWDFQRGRYDDDLDAWRRAHAEAVERRAAGD